MQVIFNTAWYENYVCEIWVKSNSSLTKSKIPEAANTILQYGAKGYGIFTSCVIDSTLHDMLDGFSSNLRINTDIRNDVYSLERFLVRNIGLRKKYFGK